MIDFIEDLLRTEAVLAPNLRALLAQCYEASGRPRDAIRARSSQDPLPFANPAPVIQPMPGGFF